MRLRSFLLLRVDYSLPHSTLMEMQNAWRIVQNYGIAIGDDFKSISGGNTTTMPFALCIMHYTKISLLFSGTAVTPVSGVVAAVPKRRKCGR